MSNLSEFVEVVKNNMECVVLKVKPDSRLGLISLGCFSGNEEMMRLTKGDMQTCTLFYKDGRSVSWEWGAHGYTLVSGSTEKCGTMIQRCLEDDFDICIAGSREAIRKTLHIKKIGDSRGMEQKYKLMWFCENDVCVHKDGCYFRHFNGLEDAKEYVHCRLDVKSEDRSFAQTGCSVLTIAGTRK